MQVVEEFDIGMFLNVHSSPFSKRGTWSTEPRNILGQKRGINVHILTIEQISGSK